MGPSRSRCLLRSCQPMGPNIRRFRPSRHCPFFKTVSHLPSWRRRQYVCLPLPSMNLAAFSSRVCISLPPRSAGIACVFASNPGSYTAPHHGDERRNLAHIFFRLDKCFSPLPLDVSPYFRYINQWVLCEVNPGFVLPHNHSHLDTLSSIGDLPLIFTRLQYPFHNCRHVFSHIFLRRRRPL